MPAIDDGCAVDGKCNGCGAIVCDGGLNSRRLACNVKNCQREIRLVDVDSAGLFWMVDRAGIDTDLIAQKNTWPYIYFKSWRP